VIGAGDKRRLLYNDLNIEQFIIGYATIMEREPDIVLIVRNMISHLKLLFNDSLYYGWDRAKNSHGVVLTDMEDGLYSWIDKDRVAETRRLNAQRPVLQTTTSTNSDSKNSGTISKKPIYKVCYNFNRGTCGFETDHINNKFHWHHVCIVYKNPGHVEAKCTTRMQKKGFQ
jgi:hypothetical protein